MQPSRQDAGLSSVQVPDFENYRDSDLGLRFRAEGLGDAFHDLWDWGFSRVLEWFVMALPWIYEACYGTPLAMISTETSDSKHTRSARY